MDRFNSLTVDKQLDVLEKGFFVYDNYCGKNLDSIKLIINSQVSEQTKKVNNENETLKINVKELDIENKTLRKLYLDKDNEAVVKRTDEIFDKVINSIKVNDSTKSVEEKLNELINKIKQTDNSTISKLNDLSSELKISNSSSTNLISNRLGDLSNEMKTTNKDTITNITKLINPTNSYDVGVRGEDWIESYVVDNLHSSIINNTRTIKGGGDIFMEYNNIKYVIESKNRGHTIPTTDIDDFRSKAIIEKEMSNIDIGIFIAQRAKRIAKKKLFDVEVVETKNGRLFLIYISDVYNYPQLVTASVNLGEILVVDNNTNNTDKLNNALSYIQNTKSNIDGLLKNIRSQRKFANSMLLNIEENETMCINMISGCGNVINNNRNERSEEMLTNKLEEIYTKLENSDELTTAVNFNKLCKSENIPKRDIATHKLNFRVIKRLVEASK
jgi:hypothetical protein